ncbi:MAG TPA: YggT family protein [Propionibacteriaceae bacterium]|nr:YggT family protein [Propionibacteriaceae bacterium]
MYVAGMVIATLLQIYFLLMVLRMVLSWVTVLAPDFTPRGVLLVVFEAVYTLTDPPIRFFSRFLPNVHTAGISFSLGFLAAMLSIVVAMQLNAALLLR